MTAEIAILNKAGVALAADSNVTLGGKTVYPSAEKLFMVSQKPAVGLMIYHNASFMGLPWEMIFRELRDEMEHEYDSLDGYAEATLNFLENNQELFPRNAVPKQVEQVAHSTNEEIKQTIFNEVVTASFREDKSSRAAKQMMSQLLGEYLDDLKEMPSLKDRRNGDEDEPVFSPEDILKDFGQKIHNVVEAHTQSLSTPFREIITSTGKERIVKIVAEKIANEQVNQSIMSGLVIAGFGGKQHFPSLRAYRLEGVYYQTLKYETEDEIDISRDESAFVKPFAQQRVVHRFMQGLDPKLDEFIGEFWNYWLREEYPSIAESLFNERGGDTEVSRQVKEELRKVGGDLLQEFGEGKRNWSRNKIWGPIVRTVKALPKSELGEMAEALVNLTSFERHVSDELETVGGPIDVGVLTKGDGFVWINRKHYFDSEINHAFFENHYPVEDE